MPDWTEVGIFACNVVEGLGFAAIVWVFGMLIRGGLEHDRRDAAEQETTTSSRDQT